jgi:hypothetical protein
MWWQLSPLTNQAVMLVSQMQMPLTFLWNTWLNWTIN